MCNVLIAVLVVVAFFLVCRLLSLLLIRNLDIQCPKCGGKLHYHITEEKNRQGLRYVDYECENCGWAKRLPEEE